MNILIPMAGRGVRFTAENYKLPKPLINIRGKAMIVRAIESLNLDGNYFFVIRDDEYREEIESQIRRVVPHAVFIAIDYVTEGPASSALLFESYITSDELVITNCDQIMTWNSKHFLYNARYPEYDGLIVTYYSDTEKNSYALINTQGYVTKIREKDVISHISLNGIHYWQNGRFFVQSATEMIRHNDRAPNGEFYIAPTYNYLIHRGHKIGIYHIPNEQHHPVGVPVDLERYLQYYDSHQ